MPANGGRLNQGILPPRLLALTTRWGGDATLATVVILIVAMMIVPLPTPLIDVLIATNLAVGVVLMLVALVARDGVALTSLPTVLLVTTLYRLALNVSSTRLILLQADAGSVIRAFGDFVVRGDYLVGAVIFLILTLIQYVVIARGAERVAEVGARFTLDAMPGKQLAIDGDLRLGTLTPDAAHQRRRALDRESQLYGAMDGAMKFVKGDAIASIAISIINLVAGAAIGVSSRGLDLVSSLKTYGLLTVGDGLVSQIPALLISTSAAIVVTRVASEDPAASLADDIGRQLLGAPRVLWGTALFLALLALVPGLPLLPFSLVAIATAGLALWTGEKGRTRGVASTARGRDARLIVKFGRQAHADLCDSDGRLLGAVQDTIARGVFERCGVAIPKLAAVVDSSLPATEAQLFIDGARAVAGEGSGASQALVDGLCTNASRLFGVEQTQQLIESVAQSQPTLVRSLVPSPLPLTSLTLVLQRLLDEGVSLRHAHVILDCLATYAPREQDIGKLAARARTSLQLQISQELAPNGELSVFQLDPLYVDTLRDAFVCKADIEQLALAPQLADDIVLAVHTAIEQTPQPVVLTPDDIRRATHLLLQRELPRARVISVSDLAPDVLVTTVAWIGPHAG